MARILTIIVALVALAVPAGSLADDAPSPADQSTAQKRCRDQLKSMTTKDFRSLYGTNANGRNAFGKCVSKLARQEAENRQNAAQECRAEQTADPEAFTKKYGTNTNGRNAFGKCVSQKAKAQSQDEQEATENAAKACKAERKNDPAAFADRYGKTKHAFGKCVSSKVKQQ